MIYNFPVILAIVKRTRKSNMSGIQAVRKAMLYNHLATFFNVFITLQRTREVR